MLSKRIMSRSVTWASVRTRRYLSTPPPPPPPPPKTPSPHAGFYTTLLPSMIPIALLGSAIYLGLEMWRSGLAHEKAMLEAKEQLKQIEADIATELKLQQAVDERRNPVQESSEKPKWRLW